MAEERRMPRLRPQQTRSLSCETPLASWRHDRQLELLLEFGSQGAPGREPPRASISGSLQKMEDIAHELDADSDDQQRQRSARHVWRSSRTESGSLDSPESEEYARHVRIKERP